MNAKNLDNVSKDIDTKVEAMVKIKNEIDYDVNELKRTSLRNCRIN